MNCPHCGRENTDDAVLCTYCSLPLQPSGSTRRLESSSAPLKPGRWGTARLGQGQYLLLHIRGHSEPLRVLLEKSAVLGRTDPDTGEAPDISLDDYGAAEQGVSRRHAILSVDEVALRVEDLGSANHSYINGQRLIPHQPRILRDGDELRLGQLVMHVHFA